MRNKLFVLLAAILVASLVLGCVKPPPPPPPEKPTPPPGKPAPDPREQMIAQAKEEGEVVIMGSTALKGFQEKYPFITVKGMALNTANTVNRAVMEARAGRVTVDMVEISDEGQYLMAQLGALQKPEVPYPHMKDFDPRFQPSSGLFVVVLLNPRPLFVYNTELVPPDELPRSWEEATDPKWTGKTLISVSGEDKPGRLAWLWREDGELAWERSFDWWTKIFQQEPLVTNGYRRGAEQLAAGERAIFWLTPPGPARRLYFDGAPVAIHYVPPVSALGNRSMGITKDAPHPAAAWLLIDYYTSPEGQFEATEIRNAALPLNKRAKPGKLAQFIMEAGGTWENSEASRPDFTMDAAAAVVYTPENRKKSEDFFLQQMGVR